MAIICHHPYGTDTFALLPDDSIWASRYPHEQGMPTIVIADTTVPVPGYASEYDSAFGDCIAVARSESAFIDLSITGKVGTGVCSVYVTGIKLDDSPENENLRLHTVVLEDSLIPQPFGGRQDHVPRKYLPALDGQPFLLAARLDTLCDTFAFNPEGMHTNELSIVADIQDAATNKTEQTAEMLRFPQ
jgi:hypothetical protein